MHQRSNVLVGLVLIAAGGCAAPPHSTLVPPPAVEPTLAGWRSAGVVCDPGLDGAPPGTYQWYCSGTVHGVAIHVRLEGTRHGVLDVVASVSNTTSTPDVAAAFAGLMVATPPVAPSAAAIASWLRHQEGSDVWADVGAVQVHLVRDDTSLTLYIWLGERQEPQPAGVPSPTSAPPSQPAGVPSPTSAPPSQPALAVDTQHLVSDTVVDSAPALE